jgi:hypothetical protein
MHVCMCDMFYNPFPSSQWRLFLSGLESPTCHTNSGVVPRAADTCLSERRRKWITFVDPVAALRFGRSLLIPFSCIFLSYYYYYHCSPCPAAAARGKVARCYTGPMDSPVAKSMIKCDSRGPLMIHCVKLYASPDGQSFSVFGRIYSGTVKPGKIDFIVRTHSTLIHASSWLTRIAFIWLFYEWM